MANRKTYVVGALGVLVGMVVASSAQRAQTVSFSGHNPNSEVVRQMPHLRRASGVWRQRSEEEALGNIFTGGHYRITSPRRSSLSDNIERRRNLRVSKSPSVHFAAPGNGTVRGAPALPRQVVPECAGLTRQRYTRCLEAYISGEPYHSSVWPIEYENER